MDSLPHYIFCGEVACCAHSFLSRTHYEKCIPVAEVIWILAVVVSRVVCFYRTYRSLILSLKLYILISCFRIFIFSKILYYMQYSVVVFVYFRITACDLTSWFVIVTYWFFKSSLLSQSCGLSIVGKWWKQFCCLERWRPLHISQSPQQSFGSYWFRWESPTVMDLGYKGAEAE